MEKRNLNIQLEVRNIGNTETDEMVIEGVVNNGNFSKVLGWGDNTFVERIERNAFQRAIDTAKAKKEAIKLLFNHSGQSVLASTLNDSLELREVDGELHMRATLCDTTLNRDVYTMAKCGLVDAFSFGFSVLEERWERQSKDVPKRIVEELKLFEVSLLNIEPAYGGTSVSARSEDDVDDVVVPSEAKLFEMELRDLGFTSIEELKEAIKAEVLAEIKPQESTEQQEDKQEDQQDVVQDEQEEVAEPFSIENAFGELFTFLKENIVKQEPQVEQVEEVEQAEQVEEVNGDSKEEVVSEPVVDQVALDELAQMLAELENDIEEV